MPEFVTLTGTGTYTLEWDDDSLENGLLRASMAYTVVPDPDTPRIDAVLPSAPRVEVPAGTAGTIALRVYTNETASGLDVSVEGGHGTVRITAVATEERVRPYFDVRVEDLPVGTHVIRVAPQAEATAYDPVYVRGKLVATGVDTTTDGDGDKYAVSDDCDDGNAAIHPDADEVCGNAIDEDCDGVAQTAAQCDADGDRVSVEDGDCDDTNAAVYPGALEACNGADDDCDQIVDERFVLGGPCTDGVGECAVTGVVQCASSGLSTQCSEASRAPGDEICDGKDNDCDSETDEGNVCTDYCAPSPCQNGGTCVNGFTGCTCDCVAGYEGTNCETNTDDCAQSPCLNGGTCLDGVARYSCDCADGYEGTNCETNTDDCAQSPCLNGGACVDGVASYTCDLPMGTKGRIARRTSTTVHLTRA